MATAARQKPRRQREMGVAFGEAARRRESLQHVAMAGFVVGLQFDELAQRGEPLLGVCGQEFDYSGEQSGLQGAIAFSFGREPGIEERELLRREPVEEVAFDDSGEPFETGNIRPGERRLGGAVERESVDVEPGQVDRDEILVGPHASRMAVVEHTADLRQAPAQFPARVVRTVPENLAKSRAMQRPSRHEQVSQKAAHFA